MKKMILKTTKILASAFAMTMIYTGIASAHVTVNPKESAPGAWETYTVKVPTEKEIPTTKVTLKIPSKFEFESYQPVQGWTFNETKDSSGKVTSVTWSATKDGILPGQFQQFVFVVKNPDTPVDGAWDAYQYYKDGSIVEWTGDEGAATPHSITKLVNSTTTKEEPAVKNETKQQEAKATESKKESKNDSTSFVLSIGALVVSIISLLVALLKKK